MGLTCVGAWIKVASVAPGRFWILLLGQSIVGISQVLILPLPPKLAAVWFGPNEVSTACSIGIIGNQVNRGTLTILCKTLSRKLNYKQINKTKINIHRNINLQILENPYTIFLVI